ncbi:RDD family protein [Amantichitinum ursilacus]|uniref:RDD family protein n=1 Tax=Amantichitinum ursilacus TaxID=857265 RepID=A0A0N0GNQ3_9NEIS|nr:RDD family protein [Amantichitinum ursilacus]KPC53064.1 RDD family protein [Amantichitinum ursilacus]
MTTPNLYQAPAASLQPAPEYLGFAEPATRSQRFQAAALDFLYLGVPPLFMSLVLPRLGLEQSTLQLYTGLLEVVYGVICIMNLRMMMRHRQSLGKRHIGIRIVRSDGSEISLRRLFLLRAGVLAVAVTMLNFVTVGLGFAFKCVDGLFVFNSRRQCLHDMLADSKVIQARL